MEHYIIALDLGTDKITCMASLVDEREPFLSRMVYIETIDSVGIRRGEIRDTSDLAPMVKNLVNNAKKKVKPGMKMWFIASVGGMNYHSELRQHDFTNDEPKITEARLMRELEALRSKVLANDGEFVSRLVPAEYTIDGNKYIGSVAGQMGNDVRGKYLAIFSKTATQTAINALLPDPRNKIFKLYTTAASKGAVFLREDDSANQAVVLVDLGAETTSVGAFWKGTLRFTLSLPFGMHSVRADIMEAFSCGLRDAERLQSAFGLQAKEHINGNESVINVRFDHDKIEVDLNKFDFVVRARIQEIIAYVDSVLIKNFSQPIKSIVLTGGGAQMKGITEAFRQRMQTNIRIAEMPITAGGLSESAAGVLGMTYLCIKENRQQFADKKEQPEEKEQPAQQPTLFDDLDKKQEEEKQAAPHDDDKKGKGKGKLTSFFKTIGNAFNDDGQDL